MVIPAKKKIVLVLDNAKNTKAGIKASLQFVRIRFNAAYRVASELSVEEALEMELLYESTPYHFI